MDSCQSRVAMAVMTAAAVYACVLGLHGWFNTDYDAVGAIRITF